MKNKNWNREFPEVPDTVHESVQKTLAALEDQEDKKVKKKSGIRKKHTVLIFAAVMAAALGMSAAASGLFQWNEQAETVFQAEPKVENELVMEQIAQEPDQSVSDNGVTIRAVQIIQDSNCFYGLFEVTAEETVQIDENCSMEYVVDFPDGEDPFVYMGWGFVGNSRQEVSNSRYFEIYGTKMSPEEYQEANEGDGEFQEADLHMNIQFTALLGPGEKAVNGNVLVEGNWPFSLEIHPAETVRYDVRREVEIEGCQVMVQSVEFSPISMVLTCGSSGIRQLEQKEGVSLDQLDSLQSMWINGIKYEDGSVVEEDGYMGLREWIDESVYVKTVRFSNVIEPEKVSALLLGENMTEVVIR